MQALSIRWLAMCTCGFHTCSQQVQQPNTSSIATTRTQEHKWFCMSTLGLTLFQISVHLLWNSFSHMQLECGKSARKQRTALFKNSQLINQPGWWFSAQCDRQYRWTCQQIGWVGEVQCIVVFSTNAIHSSLAAFCLRDVVVVIFCLKCLGDDVVYIWILYSALNSIFMLVVCAS